MTKQCESCMNLVSPADDKEVPILSNMWYDMACCKHELPQDEQRYGSKYSYCRDVYKSGCPLYEKRITIQDIGNAYEECADLLRRLEKISEAQMTRVQKENYKRIRMSDRSRKKIDDAISRYYRISIGILAGIFTFSVASKLVERFVDAMEKFQ